MKHATKYCIPSEEFRDFNEFIVNKQWVKDKFDNCLNVLNWEAQALKVMMEEDESLMIRMFVTYLGSKLFAHLDSKMIFEMKN